MPVLQHGMQEPNIPVQHMSWCVFSCIGDLMYVILCVQGMSFAKGLSANLISTPSLAFVPSAMSSGSESTLRSAEHSSGISSISASATQPSHSLVPWYVCRGGLCYLCNASCQRQQHAGSITLLSFLCCIAHNRSVCYSFSHIIYRFIG